MSGTSRALELGPERAGVHGGTRAGRIHRRSSWGEGDFDPFTANFETLAPALLWLYTVLGFGRFWHVEVHTDDVRVDEHGSGLRSVVMHDPASGVKFANNEPLRPFFKASQINVFHEEHRGDGVQHVALGVADITATVRTLRERADIRVSAGLSAGDLEQHRSARANFHHQPGCDHHRRRRVRT